MANPTRTKLIFKLIAAAAARTSVLGALLFLSAGTLSWWRGWVFLAVMFAATATMMLGVNQDLVAERLKGPFQKGSRSDKILAVALIPAIAGQFVFIGLDVSRLHLLGKPNVIVSSLGLAMCIAGFWIMHVGMRENAFAMAVVRHQEERGQVVVDTGPYHVVRHPMYSGGVLLFVGMPLWLQSSAGALLAIVLIGLFMLRIFMEESLLRRELPGYTAYAERVRYRLIPFLW
ncbi:MAG: isoprenylcysteine carboxylmethyltransferase family protein [Candidatus Acidiferrum sp.]